LTDSPATPPTASSAPASSAPTPAAASSAPSGSADGSRTSGPNFYTQLASILNSDQSHSVVLCGNVYDLYEHDGKYVPLVPLVCARSHTTGIYRIVYELNGPIRVLDEPERLKNAWIAWRAGVNFDTLLVKGMQQRKGASDIERLGQEYDRLLLKRPEIRPWPWKHCDSSLTVPDRRI